MDLIPLNFQNSPLLKYLPPLDSLTCRTREISKLRIFEGTKNGQPLSVLSLAIIGKEENVIWKSCLDMFEHALHMAASQVKGVYEWNVLSLDLRQGLKEMNVSNFCSLLVNHAKNMQPLEEVLIQYGSIFGILKKRMNEIWGRMELVTGVEIYQKDISQLDLLIKKLLKESLDLSNDCWIILHDLSDAPIFRYGEEKQTERLRKLLERTKKEMTRVSSIYIVQGQSAVELFGQFNIW